MSKLKTRLELLEKNFYTSTLGKILEKEINLTLKKRKAIIAKPNDLKYQEVQKEVMTLEKELEDFRNFLIIIIEMIAVEKNKNGKKV